MQVIIPHVRAAVLHFHTIQSCKVSVGTITAVYDCGVPLTRTATYPPRPGTWWRHNPYGTEAILGAPPHGVVTVDVRVELPESHVFTESELCGAADTDALDAIGILRD